MSKNGKRLWNDSAQETGKQTPLKYEEVARVAYELYEQRGRQEGFDQADWFKAETIVKQREKQ